MQNRVQTIERSRKSPSPAAQDCTPVTVGSVNFTTNTGRGMDALASRRRIGRTAIATAGVDSRRGFAVERR